MLAGGVSDRLVCAFLALQFGVQEELQHCTCWTYRAKSDRSDLGSVRSEEGRLLCCPLHTFYSPFTFIHHSLSFTLHPLHPSIHFASLFPFFPTSWMIISLVLPVAASTVREATCASCVGALLASVCHCGAGQSLGWVVMVVVEEEEEEEEDGDGCNMLVSPWSLARLFDYSIVRWWW